MTPKDLFAVAIATIAVWLISIAIVAVLAVLVGHEFSYLVVGLTLLAVAGFIARSRTLLP